MSISRYELRTMLAALEQMYPPTTFLLDTFFSKEINKCHTESVDIDIVKGTRKLAPFVKPTSQGTLVERRGYTANSIKLPYIKPKIKTTADDIILYRPAGMTINATDIDLQKRADEQVGKDLAYLQDMCVRREEWMAAQLLNEGKVLVSGEGFEAEVDFQMSATHKIAVGTITAWSESTADPLANLKTWSLLVKKDSGLVADICIMGLDVAEVFIKHPLVRPYFDLKKVDFGEIKPTLLPDGVEFIGTLRYPGAYFDIYTYSEIYDDPSSGEATYYVPLKKVWIGSTRARCSRQYAVIKDLKSLSPVQWFPKTWEEEDPSCRWLMLQSAPLPCLHQVDAFVSAEVLS